LANALIGLRRPTTGHGKGRPDDRDQALDLGCPGLLVGLGWLWPHALYKGAPHRRRRGFFLKEGDEGNAHFFIPPALGFFLALYLGETSFFVERVRPRIDACQSRIRPVALIL